MIFMDILMIAVCTFNIYGLLFLMSSTERITDVLGRMKLKAKICSEIIIIIIAEIVLRTDIYMIWFLVLEYILFLLKYLKMKRECMRTALWGIVSLIIIVLTELLIIYYYYHIGIKKLWSTGRINCKIQVACYLGMALVEAFLIISREAIRMKSGYKRIVLFMLELKVLTDMVWLYISITTRTLEKEVLVIGFLFVVGIVIDYFSYCVMVLKLAERSVQKKRADIHVNAYEYYLNMEEEHRRIRKLYHEMKNQLMIMDEEKTGNPGQENIYGQNVQQKLERLNKFYHTGCSSLDMLLFDGRMKAEKRGIEFEAVVSEGCLSFMEDEDINIIFSNAIINAIEACEKIKDGPKKIKIKAGKNLEDTLIYIKNTVSSDRKKGSLSTNKKNRKMHGIGLTSIQECVEKYNGYVSIMEEDNTFQLAILFGKGD